MEKDIEPRRSSTINTKELKAKISFLEEGVQHAYRQRSHIPSKKRERITLEGEDHGLYAKLSDLTRNLGIRLEDKDEVSQILLKGAYGMYHSGFPGGLIMLTENPPLQRAKTLSHELAHHFTPHAQKDAFLAESIAEGAAFVICDFFGLNSAPRSFPWLADLREGVPFTEEVKKEIEVVSFKIIKGIKGIGK